MFQDIEQLFDEINAKSKTTDIATEKKETLTQKSVASDNGSLDKLFDSLTNDVSGATSFITKVIDQKEELIKEKKKLEEEKMNFLKEKADFEKLVDLQNAKLKQEKDNFEEYMQSQKDNLKKIEEDNVDIYHPNIESNILEEIKNH